MQRRGTNTRTHVLASALMHVHQWGRTRADCLAHRRRERRQPAGGQRTQTCGGMLQRAARDTTHSTPKPSATPSGLTRPATPLTKLIPARQYTHLWRSSRRGGCSHGRRQRSVVRRMTIQDVAAVATDACSNGDEQPLRDIQRYARLEFDGRHGGREQGEQPRHACFTLGSGPGLVATWPARICAWQSWRASGHGVRSNCGQIG